MRRWLAGLLLAAVSPGFAGCGTTSYALRAVLDEIRFLSSAVPIEKALDDPTLTEDQRDKLRLIVKARDYAEQVIGLRVGGSYRQFVNLHGGSLTWNLSASRKDRFEPYVWNIPIAGAYPYLGYFKLDDAKAERDRLVALGYDTYIYEVDAFSTLGLLPDPVASPLLRRTIGSLADTVMHELTHNTIWRPGDSTFNESLANFVGRAAGLEFLTLEYGSDAEVIRQTRESNEDIERFNTFLLGLVDELRALYDSDLPAGEKIERRKPMFEAARERFADQVLPLMHNRNGFRSFTEKTINNAFLLVTVRYNSGQDVFDRVFAKVGGDWTTALAVFRQAAADADPFAFLEEFAEKD